MKRWKALKVEHVRYEARSRGRSSPDSSASWACETWYTFHSVRTDIPVGCFDVYTDCAHCSLLSSCSRVVARSIPVQLTASSIPCIIQSAGCGWWWWCDARDRDSLQSICCAQPPVLPIACHVVTLLGFLRGHLYTFSFTEKRLTHSAFSHSHLCISSHVFRFPFSVSHSHRNSCSHSPNSCSITRSGFYPASSTVIYMVSRIIVHINSHGVAYISSHLHTRLSHKSHW